jgi:hypothetical protein
MRIVLVVLGFSVAACGDNLASFDSRVVLVSTDVGRGEGLDLAAWSILEEATDGGRSTAADFCIGQAMVISLRGHGDETFCGKGRDFARVGDIPTDLDACPFSLGKDWAQIAYLDAAARHPPEESYSAGDGYLVRDREGAVYRMLVVSDALDAEGRAIATLDIEPVP